MWFNLFLYLFTYDSHFDSAEKSMRLTENRKQYLVEFLRSERGHFLQNLLQRYLYSPNNNKTRRMLSESFQKLMIKELWTPATRVWKNRNKVAILHTPKRPTSSYKWSEVMILTNATCLFTRYSVQYDNIACWHLFCYCRILFYVLLTFKIFILLPYFM